MNEKLLDVVKKIVAEHGQAVLADPKRLAAFLADLARDVPKAQKNALIRCVQSGHAQTLKNTAEAERQSCKQRLAKKLNEDEGLELRLCEETVELLALAMFVEEPKKIFCSNCGKELQEGWKARPHCGTVAEIGADTSGSKPPKPNPKPNPRPVSKDKKAKPPLGTLLPEKRKWGKVLLWIIVVVLISSIIEFLRDF